VKLRAVAALGNWLLRLEHWSAAAQQRVAEGVREKESVRRTHLRILNQVGHDGLGGFSFSVFVLGPQ